MFNAKLLTPILLVCLAAVHSGLTQPQLDELAKENQQTLALQKTTGDLRAEMGALQRFEPIAVGHQDIDQVMVESLARWTKTQKDYGVTIMETAGATNGAGGQTVVPTAQMRSVNAASGLQSQEVVLKGSYIALEDLQGFFADQVVSQGACISGIKLKGYAFEARVQLFGRTPKGA